jgi:hypothetical protein
VLNRFSVIMEIREVLGAPSVKPSKGGLRKGKGFTALSTENAPDNSQLSVLADEIRHFRKKNNFSLEMLADASGVAGR